MMRPTLLVVMLAAAISIGCRRPPPRPGAPAPRIVSFSPAVSGILFEMGLGRQVVGVTTFCELPETHRDIPVVGDRTRVSTEAILTVEPDLVLIQQNPTDFAAVTKIDPELRVEHFTIETLSDIAAAIERIGDLTDRTELAAQHKATFIGKLEAVRAKTSQLVRPKVLFLLGYDRPSTGGAGTFISEMIESAGGINAATADGYSGWKTLNRENIQAMAPEVLICQVGVARADAAAAYWRTLSDLPAVQGGRVYFATDSRWTVPSIWSADFAQKLAAMVHPDIRWQGATGE